ncbi:TonB-dependent hemoglobin/transferrin/lactoferrin family receptor [Vibrio mediterranei]|uniref:TonB-dependent hemoglobin/transferrin/lactoferrin family receptor n=1 Tax=Vibrio mediterranei TaxID=689 RepID=UPI0022838566|nr:TonB-dependent hemoglobin/transferrin/lactoferrin family receptor [Vibrio mediterranei]MCY9853781.1 TonB-dependent hemoglobin/transferrin/lactoferrin family receptor [Vibrio mediterranei]
MKLKLSIIASSVVLALSSNAFAENDVSSLNEVVVTGSRAEKTDQDKTRSVAKVDLEKLDEIQPNSVAEAIKYEPNVSVVGANVPGNQSINIRGLSGNKVLQVIDGNRQNMQYGHRPTYFLDPSLLGSVEVVKGPISSLYGSGAIGGVVVQNTLSADDIVEENGLGGRVKVGYQDNGDVWTNTAALANKNDNIDWILAGSYKDSGYMKQGDGSTLYGTEATNKTGLAKFNWQINEAHKLGFNLRYADLDGRPPVVGDSSGQLNDPDGLISRRTKDQSYGVNYVFNPNNPWVNLEASLYRNDTKITENDPSIAGEDISQVNTTGFNLTNQSESGKLKLFTGVDGYLDELDATRAASVSGRPELPKDAQTSVIGAFGYINYQIVESLVADLGVRYDSFTSKAQGYDDNNQSAWSPSVGLLWQAKQWMAWSIRYDEAFRAPDTSELYMSGTHFAFGPGGPSNIFVPNPELNPEKSHNIELKGQFNFENVFADDSLDITAAAFQNKVKDFINLDVDMTPSSSCGIGGSLEGCAGTSRSSNIDNAELTGYEVAADYRWQQLLVGLSYGQTRGKDTDTDEWITNIPADKWVAHLQYGFWNIDTKIGTRATFVSAQDRVPTGYTEGPFDSYQLVDFYASWEPTSNLEGLKVDLSLINAFDENYRTAWTQVYQPGRSVRLNAQYTF